MILDEFAFHGIISRMGETIGQSTVHEREMNMAQQSLVSSFLPAEIRKETGLPETVDGLTIVDLAAGACSLTAELLEQGANAYALDCLYDDRQRLLDNVYQKWLKSVLNGIPAPDRKEAEDMIKREVRKFMRSFNRQPDRYLTGWLTELPFADNFADWTISNGGISMFWQDREVQRKAMMEAIRITKPGGVVAVMPFITNLAANRANQEALESHLDLHDFLEQQGVGQVIIERVPS